MSQLTDEQKQQLEELRKQGKELGINTGNKSIETLTKEIAEETEKRQSLAKQLTPAQKKLKASKEAQKLVRVRITCQNPNKREWQGELIRVSNKYSGSIAKFVPFGVEYHLPVMILNALRDRKCQVFKTVTNKKNGMKTRKGYQIPEFVIDELPQLTKEELAELAAQQGAANELED